MLDPEPVPHASSAGVVLVVDDDAAVRSALAFSLQAEGFIVRLYDGAEALLADRELPAGSCLVVDYRMPGLDGVQLVEILRARGAIMPAILITGRASPHLRDSAARAGIHRVVEKPLSDEALVNGIREVLAA